MIRLDNISKQNGHQIVFIEASAALQKGEKTGLSNEELSHCHWLTTIPMYPHEGVRHASMIQASFMCIHL